MRTVYIYNLVMKNVAFLFDSDNYFFAKGYFSM